MVDVPVMKLEEMDPRTWMDIPAMAEKFGVKRGELGIVMLKVGLRREVPHIEPVMYEPSQFAVTLNVVVRIDIPNKPDTVMFRWHFPKVKKYLLGCEYINIAD